MSESRRLSSPAVEWHAHADESAWIEACVRTIAEGLARDLEQHPQALLLLSGGGTPVPVYRALAREPLAWSRVVVSLVDERWTPPDSPGNNARLLRETLLTGHAAEAELWPLAIPDMSIDDAVRLANRRLDATRLPLAAVVLGIGGDGHTASLFPGASNLDSALASTEAYVAIDASGCPGAGDWPQRISLTPAGLAAADTRLLLLRGGDKRAVFERAQAGDDIAELPVRAVLAPAGASSPLQVHWCP